MEAHRRSKKEEKEKKFLNYFLEAVLQHLMGVLSIFPQWGTTTPKGFRKKLCRIVGRVGCKTHS